jgi:hypothetical protein
MESSDNGLFRLKRQNGAWRVIQAVMVSRLHSLIAVTLETSSKALQPTALERCAPMSILISVLSTVAQPRSQSGG